MVESKGSAAAQPTPTATVAASTMKGVSRGAFSPAIRGAFAAALAKQGARGTSSAAVAGASQASPPRVVTGTSWDDADGKRGGQGAPSTKPSERDPNDETDPLDPIFRQHDLLAPPHATEIVAAPPPIVATRTDATTPVQATARASLEEVLPAIVRRIAWSGDGKKGTVRLEFGAGALAGATLLVESDDGRVRVRLSAPPGVDTEGWRKRIGERLAARRIAVDGVEVE